MTASRDPKVMAKALRGALAARDITLTHSDCLELVARQLGYADWNTAVADQSSDGKPFGPFQLPMGWTVSGTDASGYKVGIDPDKLGEPATIRSLDDKGPHNGFATLMQSTDAAKYVGYRIMMNVELSCAHVLGAATIWLRIDDRNGGTLRFDNMETRADDGVLSGTQDWVRRSIVLEVPETADSLNYGFYLRGSGQCWSRGFSFRQVDDSVPVTSEKRGKLKEPVNLDFARVSSMAQ